MSLKNPTLLLILSVSLLVFGATAVVRAEAAGGAMPTRYSMSVSGGNSYFPDSSVGVALLTYSAILDYNSVWSHPAPENLRLKLEVSAGIATEPKRKSLVSADMLALLYPYGENREGVTPYVEAGIGLIYTDFRRPGQGLNLNFHPILGAGVEYDRFILGLRVHHLSNSHLHNRNKSLDFLMLQVGFFF